MTAANGTPVGDHRRPSAASRSAVARGAPPPTGLWARKAHLRRRCRRAVSIACLGAVFAGSALPLLQAGAREGLALLGGMSAVPSSGFGRVLAQRMPDRPNELLPPPSSAAVRAAAAASPRAACLAAARRAEQIHGLPEGLMVAIALSESGLHAHALNIGGRAVFPDDVRQARAMLAEAGGQGRSVMAGCVQVNAGVHARGSDWPLDAERATDWAGGVLRRWFLETGSWTAALARWHGGSPAGTHRVLCRVRAKLEVTAPGSNLLRDAGCNEGEIARIRRNGVALLEVAEAPPGR